MDLFAYIVNRGLVHFAAIPDRLSMDAMTTLAFVYSGKIALPYTFRPLQLVVWVLQQIQTEWITAGAVVRRCPSAPW
jgi:hypothetical protein